MKESLNKIDKRIVFRETFTNEASVRANGALSTLTGWTFENGIGTANGSSNVLAYSPRKLPNTWSVRFRFKVNTLAGTQFVWGSSEGSSTYTTVTSTTLVTRVNGAGDTGVTHGFVVGNTYEVVLTNTVGGAISYYIDGVSKGNGARNTVNEGFESIGNVATSRSSFSFELFEIYNTVLTANEVKNLYENRQNRELINYSKQLVVNPDFLTDTSWAKESGWTISSGAARCDGTNSARLTQNIGTIATQQYTVRYKVNVTSGSINIQLGGNGTATTISTNTETSEVKVAGAIAPETIYLISTNFVGSIDYIYVEQIAKEILRVDCRDGVIRNKYTGSTNLIELVSGGNFDTDTTGSFTVDRCVLAWNPSTKDVTATITDISGIQIINPTATTVSGKTYRINIVAKSNSLLQSPQLWVGSYVTMSGGNYSNDYKLFTWEGVVTVTDPFLRLQANYNSNGASVGSSINIDNFSIQEVIPAVTPTAVSVVRSGNVYAMDFNGSTSMIDCGTYDNLLGDRSVAVWIYLNQSTGGGLPEQSIIDNTQFRLFFNNASTDLMYFRSSTSGISVDLFNIDARGKWTFIVITRTSTGLVSSYINGALNVANSASGTPVAGTNIIIGNNASSNKDFTGKISNIRVYNGILTAQEIAQLFLDEKANYNL